jgi:GNAT superfamily N-acetyltransferase
MVIAFDRAEDRPVGAASLTVRDGVATLGGMSTVPSDRGRGVQAALICYRLERAHQLGCVIASSTAATGGDSERNLRRHGFQQRFVVATWLVSPPT